MCALSTMTDIRYLECTSSTNDEARALIEAGDADGLTIVADQQTRGRGRLDRVWHSPKGANLYLSQIVRADPATLPLVPLLAALATRATVAAFLPVPLAARIKWPNDILVVGRKLAGILCELVTAPSPAAIVGIGINLNLRAGEFPEGLRTPAASLRMLRGKAVDRATVIDRLLIELDRWLRSGTGRAGWREAFRSHCATLGQKVRVSGGAGEPWTGTARDIDSAGRLLVEDALGKLVPVEAGDVDPIKTEGLPVISPR